MVHQHFTLASNLNVLDNVIIGSEPLTLLRSNRAAARAKLLALSARFGLPVDPEARISRLSVGERQRVEILKALYRDARILILDEPTAVLARPEAEQLFQTLRGMTREGLSVVFISHKLGEVMAGSDRVAVLRGGRLVAERETAATSPEELAELMVGRKVARPRRAAHATGAPVLVAERVSVTPGLSEASFEVREGEVLGIVGVSGNGQAALGALVSGQARASGRLTFQGVDFTQKTTRDWIAAGAARIPEDRHAQGIVGEMSLWENAVLERLRRPEFSRGGFVRQAAARAHTAGLIERFDIRGAGPDTRTRLLSGGNMQKLILGRNLAETPRFILANQPTRGLDEGAIAAVHGELLAAREAGAAILLITEELDEALALSDRLQAIVKGRLSAPIARRGRRAAPARPDDGRAVGGDPCGLSGAIMCPGAWPSARPWRRWRWLWRLPPD